MAGLEVAGVVLGALPIVIAALSAYKEGKGAWASLVKTRGLLDDLLHQLKAQRMEFYFDILELLREARVPDIVKDVDPTDDQCVDILRQSGTALYIQNYLGHSYYSQFLEVLGCYQKYLKKIASKLRHIMPLENASFILLYGVEVSSILLTFTFF